MGARSSRNAIDFLPIARKLPGASPPGRPDRGSDARVDSPAPPPYCAASTSVSRRFTPDPARATRRAGHEAHVPTLEPRPQAPPRLSCPHGNQGRPQDPERPPRPRPEVALGLSQGMPTRPETPEAPTPPASLRVLRVRSQFLTLARARRASAGSFMLQARDRGDDNPTVGIGF